MPDNRSISQLTTAEQTTSSDLFETAIPNGSLGYLSRKVTLDAIAHFIAKALQYSDLQTEAKTLIDAINEAAQSGGGGASIEEMTQAEYNALTPEQKADGTLRAISDATTSISDIDDVNITSPADGDAFIYDAASGKWVNKSIEGEDITFTPAQGVSIHGVSSWKVDKLCGISFDIKPVNASAGTLTSLGTVDILPSTIIRTAVTKVSDGSHIGIVRINTQGNISITPIEALSSSLSIAFSFIYKSAT